MKPISVLLHEVTEKDVSALPHGWSVLVYDFLYGQLSICKKGVDHIPNDKKRYVLLLYKLTAAASAPAGG